MSVMECTKPTTTVDEPGCAVCRRPSTTPACPRCQRRMAGQLDDLPQLWARLQRALAPGSGGGGERVTTSRGEAPMPVRLAALTLLAGGNDSARCVFLPAVRVWTTLEQEPAGLTWHRAPVLDARGAPAMVLADDQVGVLPVREWLFAWALEWRHAFGHSTAVRRPSTGRRSPAARSHHEYLRTWLPKACESNPSIGDFAASLRTLTGALRAALGDIDDLVYLGRCPELLDGDPTAVCGAPIWHDPYASVIICPRCRTETGQDRRIWLARRILDVWPIDPRRRYPRGLIEVLRVPTCLTCCRPIRVTWIDATERTDVEPFWRPGALTCPAGCDDVAA
jgi:hypothetical protein